MVALKHEKIEAEALSLAFERFQTTSARLEQRHNLLQKELEVLRAQLAEKDKEVKRAERLALLGETAAGIAHEIRNPLGALRLFVSSLERLVKDNPAALEVTEQIGTCVQSLNNVVSNILHCSSNKQLSLAPVNLQSIIAEQAAHSKASTQGTIAIHINYQASPFVLGNEDALRQIFHNVFTNASQAMSFSGTIDVSVKSLPDKGVEVQIKDQGPGFSEDIISKAFEPFVTSKNEGTGLGLAIVRRLMEQHQGSVQVFNQDGAVCVLKFPHPQASVTNGDKNV